ncbi:2338_t:CDS:2 [Ambispora gerdemannii]|uniref:2338_t:CDS:1 n=1 Tax=Ambispora gerdemannii TaxID=144530 RepID=A0A9N8Z4N1_9GLOM|nr:2338_t:CDS:2 [Ambispora gerdemannii]
MRFGQELEDDYRHDSREEIQSTLRETFSLLAYSDPTTSVMSYLLDPAHREPVANSLNSAILVSEGKPPIPPLEIIYRQASVTVRESLRNGIGAASLVNVQKDCLL